MTISRRKLFSWLVPSAVAGWVGGRANAAQPAQHAQAAQAQLNTAASLKELTTQTGAGLTGYGIKQPYGKGTVGAKLYNFITIEDFADENSAAGDWSTAIRAAVEFAANAGIHDVYGTGNYEISKPVILSGAVLGNKGLNLSLSHVVASKKWPRNTTLWDATPMIIIGDHVQVSGLNLRINMLNGGGRADGIRANGAGFALSHLHIGDARECIRVVANGEQTWPNASVQLTGDFWTDNWLAIYLSRGSKGTAPISEAWKIDVKFIAANRYGGILLRGGSQYAQIAGDHDYNGRYLSMLRVDSLEGLTRGTTVKGSRGSGEILTAFQDKHQFWVAVMEPRDVSAPGGKSSYSTGETLTSSTKSSIKRKILEVHRAADNESGTNFIDILHDFEGEPFARIQATIGYCSGIYGSLMFTSFITAQNSFSALTDNIRGLGVSSSGTILALYNRAESDSAFANITADYVNFQKKLYMGAHLYEGIGTAQVIGRSSSEFTTLFSLKEFPEDRYLQELNLYKVYIKTNVLGVAGEFLVNLTSDPAVKEPMIAQAVLWNQAAFAWRVSGYDFQVRQDSVDQMQFVANILRV
ncbi:hypothetical protein GA565_14620 [Rouxiella sp. S1S-2]|uniref:hypothetical protein n=1 Tax=Rouxiella sp. S1S-2 TaxID=2653856 RepID=UPI0012657FCC|nr:hypothetical protein [Rouxiella sp. S1S-2]KAB7897122.1 hypothetical protein GA565_14620 [Rouxiella sp. S1S-2]